MAHILSCKSGTNADLFPDVAALYIPEGSRVIDMTYANGVFWSKMDISKYDLVTNDLFNPKAAVAQDFRNLSFDSGSFDAAVLDPPYMRTNNRAGVMASNYNNQTINLRTHNAIISLYRDGYESAKRILRPGGILIVKCQDEVESRKQRWSHIELMTHEGFVAEDLFVLYRTSGILIGRCQENQKHARKNHSYFIVLRKV